MMTSPPPMNTTLATSHPLLGFSQVHRSLTVKLIATPVEELVTCGKDESPEQARGHVGTGSQQRQSPFDYLPVRERPSGPIVGFFSVPCPDSDSAERVENSPGFVRLSETHLIGARTTILEFIQSADDTPRPYLVVEGRGICGLLNSADLVHPLVGAAIAARILEFEMRLNRWIEERYGADGAWRRQLDQRALRDIDAWYERARSSGIEADYAWMYGSIRHKMTILRVDDGSLELINDRRNEVFHTRRPTEIRAGLRALKETEKALDNPEAGLIR